MIQALHWRGAEPEDGSQCARRRLRTSPRLRAWCRAGAARCSRSARSPASTRARRAAAARARRASSRALFGGDDATDLDAFNALRWMARSETLRGAVCVGVTSAEQPDGFARGPTWSSTAPRASLEVAGGPADALLRPAALTVLLVAGVATALGTVTVIVANQDDDYTPVDRRRGWWLIAGIIGSGSAAPTRAGEAMARALASARTATSLPAESPGRIAFQRLWPIGVFALVGAGPPGSGRRSPPSEPATRSDRARLAPPRRGRRGDRGARRRPLLRRALLGVQPLRLVRTPGLTATALRPRTRHRPHRRRPGAPPARPPSAAAAVRGRRSAAARENAYQPPAAAASAATAASTSAARGPAASESQPAIGPPIGVEPEEHGRVERHHPAAHRGLGGELQRRVGAGGKGDARGPERNQPASATGSVGAAAATARRRRTRGRRRRGSGR